MPVRFIENRRGGLTVDRDSLHESEGYKRQVEALEQLPERRAVMGEKMKLRECDNPGGEWCKGCRSAGMSHCSDPGHCGQMKPMAHHANCSHCRPDTGNAEADRLIGRLMSSDPGFDDCTDAAVLIRRLARAHLAQPAQLVDIEAIREVIEVRDWLLARAQDGQMQRSVYTSNYQLREMAEAINVFADKLEAALPELKP